MGVSGNSNKTGMARMYVRQCLNDTPGAQMLLECADKNEQEVMRVICSTERKRLEDLLDYDVSAKVRISKVEHEGKLYIKLLRRDSDLQEQFIRIAPDGTVSKEILLPEVDSKALDIVRNLLNEGLTLEMAEQREENGLYSYFRAVRPSKVTIALMYVKKDRGLSYEAKSGVSDEFADEAFDMINTERLAAAIKRKEERGSEDYEG
jgi:hypothetical protein